MKQLHLGAQLYTLRDYIKTAEDFRETMRKVGKIGYKYVQVSGAGPTVTPDVIKAAVDETGVRVILTHTSLERIIKETEKVIEEHELFGCNYIGVGGMGDHTETGYKKFCEDIAPAVEKIKAAGKTFLYHNHYKEFVKWTDNKNGLDIITENSDPEGLKLTLDTYWAYYAGEDVPAVINKFGKRIAVTHFKDMQILNGERTMTEMLTGIIDYDPIMKACDDNDIWWNFIEQDKVYIDAFESMKISHDNMKKRYNLD